MCFIRVGAKLCKPPALQDRVWWPLIYSSYPSIHPPTYSIYSSTHLSVLIHPSTISIYPYIVSSIYSRGAQTWSWRACVLQSLAPTCLNTPAGKILVCLVRAWLAGSGLFNWGWRTQALQDQIWAPLIYTIYSSTHLSIHQSIHPSAASIHPSIHCIYPTIYLPTLFIHPPIH